MSSASRTVTPSSRIRPRARSEEHTSELQSQSNLVCRLLLEKKKTERMRCALAPARPQDENQWVPAADRPGTNAPPIHPRILIAGWLPPAVSRCPGLSL